MLEKRKIKRKKKQQKKKQDIWIHETNFGTKEYLITNIEIHMAYSLK